MTGHCQVRYGDSVNSGTRYAAYQDGHVVLASDSKPDVIAEAQRRNGYVPVDGSEQTYGDQLAAEGLR